jgi:hypothetical protein
MGGLTTQSRACGRPGPRDAKRDSAQINISSDLRAVGPLNCCSVPQIATATLMPGSRSRDAARLVCCSDFQRMVRRISSHNLNYHKLNLQSAGRRGQTESRP